MKVLMFGWEYPPHVFGGLATANFGISQGLHAQGDIDIALCLPHPFGDEDRTAADIIAMNAVPLVYHDVDPHTLQQRIGNIMAPEMYYRLRDNIYADFRYLHTNDLGCMEFAGGYPNNLNEEINNYSIIAGVVARTLDYDLIHAHDWLTYPAGIHAKQISGKPLCIHVHATDFDRSRGKVNPVVYGIEKDGMDHADCIMCVSELTRQTVIRHYHQRPEKCFTMHNAVYPLRQDLQDMPRPDHSNGEKTVTFLGRITMQKGPEYFVEAAQLVINRTRNIRFCMAGSGDMLQEMITLVAKKGIAHRFHFPGFMRGDDVYRCLKASDVYVMPSVSEPFGISPLEAMQCGTPSIISRQSGCAEILNNCIKTDYWDIHAMADAIYSICHNPALFNYLQNEGLKEVNSITWEKVGLRILNLYRQLLH
ncbi:MAG: glycosyltransferase family 4 protein [Bacteroidaceae bacterium]|nr:glycosyltransferase family 4 protein [Bacteroidaceae bacterium]